MLRSTWRGGRRSCWSSVVSSDVVAFFVGSVAEPHSFSRAALVAASMIQHACSGVAVWPNAQKQTKPQQRARTQNKGYSARSLVIAAASPECVRSPLFRCSPYK